MKNVASAVRGRNSEIETEILLSRNASKFSHGLGHKLSSPRERGSPEFERAFNMLLADRRDVSRPSVVPILPKRSEHGAPLLCEREPPRTMVLD